jgi:hypothetical protein
MMEAGSFWECRSRPTALHLLHQPGLDPLTVKSELARIAAMPEEALRRQKYSCIPAFNIRKRAGEKVKFS